MDYEYTKIVKPALSLSKGRKSSIAFTLVELMIVVAILGILAAIVLPEFQSHSQKAKESAAKDNLRILREAILRYAAEHNDVAPGYMSNNTTTVPTFVIFQNQLTGSGRYLLKLPENPFSNQNIVRVLANDQVLDEATAAAFSITDYGWIYHPASKTIKLLWSGTDSQGIKYFDY